MRRNVMLAAYLLAYLALARAASPKMPSFFARRDYLGLFSQWVAVADTNGDGIPDLIATDQGYVEVLFGNGDGTFRSGPSQNTIAMFSSSHVATDLNGDGRVDLVLPASLESGQEGIAVCLGNGDGTFQFGVFYQAGNDTGMVSLVVGDFNGDGIPDIATPGS